MARAEQTIVVNAPVDRCYEVYSHFPDFPRFMNNVESITPKGDPKVWHWKVKGPLGTHVEWDAEVDAMEPNKVISWHSVRDSEVKNAGAAIFESLGPNETRVHVTIEYHPPAGKIGEVVADIFRDPDKMLAEDLENYRRVVTTPTYSL
jgi:uncharacterized membrane protein